MQINFSDFKNIEFVNFEQNILDAIYLNCENRIKIFDTDPLLKEYHDVIYTPHEHIPRTAKFYGFLYDSNGQIIELSRVTRGSNILGVETIDKTKDIKTIDKKVLYLGHIIDQYGHFLLESLSRLWCLSKFTHLEKEFDHFLIHLNSGSFQKTKFYKIISWLGINEEKIIWFQEPIKIKSVTVPQSSFSLKNYAYTVYKDIFTPIHQKYQDIKTTETPLYLSRRLLKEGRKINNEKQLEDYLIEKGFNVIHPQFLTMEEQIYLFNRHKYIVTTRSSAYYNVVFSAKPKTVIHLSSQDDFVNVKTPYEDNHMLIDQLFACKSYYINIINLQKYRLDKIFHKAVVDNLPMLKANYQNKYEINLNLLLDKLEKIGLF